MRRISEEELERSSRRLVQAPEKTRALLGWELPEQVSLLIGGHGVDQRRSLLLAHLLEDPGAMMCELGLIEHGNSEIGGKCGHDFRRSLGWKVPERVGDIGGAHAGKRLCEVGWVAVEQIEELRNSRH